MQLISKENCRALIEQFGYSFVDSGNARNNLIFAGGKANEIDIGFEKWPASHQVHLANVLSIAAQPFHKCMLWITEYGIWPSTEDPYMFRRMRVSYGLSDDLNNLPGHQFSSEETDDLRLFLTLVLIFGWGGYLVTECPDSRKFSLFISHDGWLSARSNNELHPLLTRLLA